MSKSLINKGVVTIGDRSTVNASRVVVVGPARGGTSLVAGVLHHLGVFMGDLAAGPTFEDPKISHCFESLNKESAKKLIQEYSACHTVWAWKRPSSINYLGLVDELFEKPMYIFIFKDVLSISQRNAISMLEDVSTGIKLAHNEYGKSIDFIAENECYALLVSYEKALAYPSAYVDQVIDFCNLKVTVSQRNDAISFITPNPEEYLDESRITKTKGRLDFLSKDKVIFGWATFAHPSKSEVVSVNIYLNNDKIATVKANVFRDDVNKKIGRSCCFEYRLPHNLDIKQGDMIRARAVGEFGDLKNSPLVVTEKEF